MIARKLASVLICLIAMVGGSFGVNQHVSAATDAESEAIATLNTYYSAIDAFDYETAWSLLGAEWQKEQPLDELTAGYAETYSPVQSGRLLPLGAHFSWQKKKK